jgi:hypothetical protein
LPPKLQEQPAGSNPFGRAELPSLYERRSFDLRQVAIGTDPRFDRHNGAELLILLVFSCRVFMHIACMMHFA